MGFKFTAEQAAQYTKFRLSNRIIIGNYIVGFRKLEEPNELGDIEELFTVLHPEAKFAAPAERMSAPHVLDWPVPGALAGVSFVVGKMGSGKTVKVMSMDVDVVIRLSEPVERFDADERVYFAQGLTDAIFAATYLASIGKKVAIDGTRSLVFAMSGNATEGGVSSMLYQAATNIALFAARHKVHFILTLNPMVRSTLVEQVFSNLASSVTGGWLMEDSEVAAETHRTAAERTFDGTAMKSGRKKDTDEASTGPVLGASFISIPDEASEAPVTPTLRAFSTRDPEDDILERARVGVRFAFHAPKDGK